MRRDIHALTHTSFDLLVVGGGIYGLTIASDAALRGLRVALIERGDFGSGSSFNHLRTIHGGLRYLQTLDLGRARESIRERRTLARIAPTYITPLPFVLPLDRSLMRGPLAMRAGFMLDAVVAADRNRDVPATHHLPIGRVYGIDEARRRFAIPGEVSSSAAAVWYDYVTTDADRLTLAWGLAAASRGAVLANYVEATTLHKDGARVLGVAAIDRRSGDTIEVAARVIVNATGGAVDTLLAPLGIALGMLTLRAMNLVTRREPPPHALGGRAPSGRNLFLVPWRNRALFGTWESSRHVPTDETSRLAQDVEAFLGDVNHAYPSMQLTRDDISLVHRGVVPALAGPVGSVVLDGGEQVHDHAAAGVENLVSVAGTKYTTARAIAERVTDLVVSKLGQRPIPCLTASTPLPVTTLSGDALLSAAARDEMVETLEDVVVRRTPLGAVGCPDDRALEHAATIVAGVLGWPPERRAQETQAVRRFYETRTAH